MEHVSEDILVCLDLQKSWPQQKQSLPEDVLLRIVEEVKYSNLAIWAKDELERRRKIA